MRINSTGFVAANSGSVAGANVVLLQGLLDQGHFVRFFSKPSFVDPRPGLNGRSSSDQFEFVECTNRWTDGMRRLLAPQGKGAWGMVWGKIDGDFYNRGLVRAMRRETDADIDLWLGDWARGRGDRPVVSFVQGPPGTDARSIERHEKLIVDLAGRSMFNRLRLLAAYRLKRGLPDFSLSDHVIVGSEWSRSYLVNHYGFKPANVSALPYPIDLEMFQPGSPRPKEGRLRVLWLGRFVPRKRLDLFLDGMALAIRSGIDAEAWAVGSSGFVPGFEKLLARFPFPERLRHWDRVPRKEVPGMLAEVDVLAQPSDEENFGSSVAEAVACGVPVIVGATNGTGDYVCARSAVLENDDPSTFAAVLASYADKKAKGELQHRQQGRQVAEQYFHYSRVSSDLQDVLAGVAGDAS